MAVTTYEQEVSCAVPPSRMFKAYVLDFENLLPVIFPQAIKGVETLEGNGGVGTVKLVTFGEGMSPYKSAKHRVDEIDEATHTFKYTVIESDALGGIIDTISSVTKIEAGPDGGSVCKITSTCHHKNENHHITEEKIKTGKESLKAIFKAVEAHLHANPNSYVLV